MGQSSGTSGRRTARARQDSASQNPDSSKEWTFDGRVATLNPCGVEWNHDNDLVPYEIRQAIPEIGEALKTSFSKNTPAEIEYVVIASDIEHVGFYLHDNEQMLDKPVRGHVATSKRVNQKEWEDSIRWYDFEQRPLISSHLDIGLWRNPLLGAVQY
jgi:hypothetical protein